MTETSTYDDTWAEDVQQIQTDLRQAMNPGSEHFQAVIDVPDRIAYAVLALETDRHQRATMTWPDMQAVVAQWARAQCHIQPTADLDEIAAEVTQAQHRHHDAGLPGPPVIPAGALAPDET